MPEPYDQDTEPTCAEVRRAVDVWVDTILVASTNEDGRSSKMYVGPEGMMDSLEALTTRVFEAPVALLLAVLDDKGGLT
jgi:hypothetical protein